MIILKIKPDGHGKHETSTPGRQGTYIKQIPWGHGEYEKSTAGVHEI